MAALLNATTTLPVSHLDEYLSKSDVSPDFRTHLQKEREEAVAYQQELAAWEPLYRRAIEYPASRIFIVLRDGMLLAKGRLLPDSEERIAEDARDVAPTDIPPSFWTLQGIDFEDSSARDGSVHYRFVTCRTEDMLAVFLGERAEVHGIERIGDSYV